MRHLGSTPCAQPSSKAGGCTQRACGDRGVLFVRNHPRYLEILWGAWWDAAHNYGKVLKTELRARLRAETGENGT